MVVMDANLVFTDTAVKRDKFRLFARNTLVANARILHLRQSAFQEG